ncbi:MAG: hypothetical protein JWQ70_3106 [Aeromicrobium sp.]|nr:hypothetical protein [Aeromicrobium sp.]
MRKILVLVLTCAAIVAVPATASATTPYVVTAAANTSSPEAGHAFSITGAVSPNAHGQTVTLSRRYATQSTYTKVATKKLTSTSHYAFSTSTGHPGKIYYKVTKSGSSTHTGGSKTVTVTVYRWRNLVDLPGTPTGVAAETASSTIRDWEFPHSIETGINGQYVYTLGGVCTRFTATIGFKAGASSSGVNAAAYVTTPYSGNPYIAASTVYKDGFGFFVTDKIKIVGMDTVTLQSVADSNTTATDRVVFGTPQVYCAS